MRSGARTRGLVAAVATAALAAGCVGPGATGTPEPVVAPDYRCGGELIEPAVLDGGRSGETLGEHGQAALHGQEVPEIEPSEWLVVSESDQRVALLRPLDAPEDLGSGDVRTHELLTAVRDYGVDPDEAPAWTLDAYGECTLRRDLGEGVATVTLDPDRPPDPTSAQVAVLVTEQLCNSGEDAEGRIHVAEQREGSTTVDLTIVVGPRGGNHTCQDNPATPFVVELDAPLGDRVVRDGAVVPPRELELPR